MYGYARLYMFILVSLYPHWLRAPFIIQSTAYRCGKQICEHDQQIAKSRSVQQTNARANECLWLRTNFMHKYVNQLKGTQRH